MKAALKLFRKCPRSACRSQAYAESWSKIEPHEPVSKIKRSTWGVRLTTQPDPLFKAFK
jgi:hypothetical protein